MKTLREIMREGFLFAVRKDATVAEAARTMTENNVGIVIVLDGDRLVGVFSERDAVRRVIDKGLDPRSTPVHTVMTKDLVVATPIGLSRAWSVFGLDGRCLSMGRLRRISPG